MRVALALVFNLVAEREVQRWCLEAESLEVEGVAAPSQSVRLKLLDQLRSDSAAAMRRCYPELLQLATEAPPATDSTTYDTAILGASETGDGSNFV